MGSTNTGTIMTIANSIIGVSVLAMPFCFKQCGIVLSILMLILSSILSRLTCYLLLKSAVMARRRNFEFLAFHIFGPTGKFVAELCIIGFLMGTCIAFFVVVGDLGPAIISKTLDMNDFSAALRPSVLIGLALIVVLPLGLLRNVDSLSSVCTVTIGFYVCLVLKVIAEATPHLRSGVWLENVRLWRPAGVMQCLPIFSMALFCQTQLFEIYDSLPNASFERMISAVRSAINLCAGVYICVGFFGYVAFCTQNFGGNILLSFSPTMMSEVMKLGFVLSLAVSFPLVIFPCRASLYSLLFRRIQFPSSGEGGSLFIPEARFKCLTVFIIAFSLSVGLLIPNIELVLGLVGSTIGVAICVMFPALAFMLVQRHGGTERRIAQALLVVGVAILVLGTYATLAAAGTRAHAQEVPVKPPIVIDVLDEKDLVARQEPPVLVDLVARQEPPVPVDPVADTPVDVPKPVDKPKSVDKPKPVEDLKLVEELKPVVKELKPEAKQLEPLVAENENKEKEKVDAMINKDALKKEDEELARDIVDKEGEKVKKEEDLLKTLEKHKEEQNKLLAEQREIIQQLKEEKEKEEVKVPAKESVVPNVMASEPEQNASKKLPQPVVVDVYKTVTPDSPQRVRLMPIKSLLRPPPTPIKSLLHPPPMPMGVQNPPEPVAMRREILATAGGKDREKREAVEVVPGEPNCAATEKKSVMSAGDDLQTMSSNVNMFSDSKKNDKTEDGVMKVIEVGKEDSVKKVNGLSEDSLIKVSVRLSDPTLGTQPGPVQPGLVQPGLVQPGPVDDMKPMSRDLKSVEGSSDKKDLAV